MRVGDLVRCTYSDIAGAMAPVVGVIIALQLKQDSFTPAVRVHIGSQNKKVWFLVEDVKVINEGR
jgi:hypothetical protein